MCLRFRCSKGVVESWPMNQVILFDRCVVSGSRPELERALQELKPSQSAFFCNVHMLMLSQEDDALAAAMDSADFVFADGVPLMWLQRALGHSDASVLWGYEAVNLICERSIREGKAVGFFGASDHVLSTLVLNLSKSFPGLKVCFTVAPPIIEQDSPLDPLLVEQINASGVNYLFVGLGCPKQEKWIHRYAPNLNCSLLGVGAAFDWLAGTTQMPPAWIERMGLAWIFRLLQNPKRMWRRYLIYNTKFVFSVFQLLVWDRLFRKSASGTE